MHGSYLFGNIKLKWMVVNKVDASFMGDYLPNLAIEESTTYAYFRQSHKNTQHITCFIIRKPFQSRKYMR